MSGAKKLPSVSHLQFLVLSVLRSGEHAGRALRRVAAGFGVRHTAAAFYQMMARLERDGLVEGWYDQVQVGDQAVKERRYRITQRGVRAWGEARTFYDALTVGAAARRWSNA